MLPGLLKFKTFDANYNPFVGVTGKQIIMIAPISNDPTIQGLLDPGLFLNVSYEVHELQANRTQSVC